MDEIKYPFEVAFVDQIKYFLEEVDKDGAKSWEFKTHDFIHDRIATVKAFTDRTEAHAFADGFIQDM